ncbi:MAG: hypothetical protein WCB51_15345 [Candidatus Dormiibacterota bacterium]
MTRPDERGIVRGCCAGLVLIIVAIAGAVFLALRALAAPALGPPPAGPSHGTSEVAIALALGTQMAAELVAGPHGVVILSEQDLTVLAVANNPHPNAYRDIQVRVRDRLVVASARISTGPFTPTAVVHVSLTLRGGASGPVISAQVPEIDLGQLGVPGFFGAGLVTQIDAALSLDRLFSIDPRLKALRDDIECVAVVPGGVAVGVHDPGVPSVASACG